MEALDLAKIPDYLRGQRWFAGKTATIQGAQVVEHVTVPAKAGEPGALIAIVEVGYSHGTPERYMAVLEAGGAVPREGAADERVARFLLSLVREGQSYP